MKYIIVLFSDGTFQIFTNKDSFRKEAFQSNARFFVVDSKVTVEKISRWIAQGFDKSFMEF